MAAATRDERLEIRIPSKLKRMIERAAALTGQSVSNFVLSNVGQRARQLIKQAEVIDLTNRDRDRLLAALDAPPEPNAALRRAVEHHDALIG